MTLTTGTRLGPYEILAPLGAGGMGEVYRACDTRLGRDVAIKVLPSTLSADADRLHRFEQGACAAGALNHPNILVIHHVDTHEGAPYIVSELLEGETLRQRISVTALAQRRVIDYALQIAHGLAAAHEKGIVHRDLKPDNIFITKDGRVKILDFGVAKLTQPDGSQSQTEIPTRRVDTDPGVAMGTVGYMSPEQLKGRAVDQRSDRCASTKRNRAKRRAFECSNERLLRVGKPACPRIIQNAELSLARAHHVDAREKETDQSDALVTDSVAVDLLQCLNNTLESG